MSAAAAPANANGGVEVCSAAADVVEVRRTGQAIDPGYTVEQEGSGEGSEQKVFQGGFIVARVIAQVAG